MIGRKRLYGRIFLALTLALMATFITITIRKLNQNKLIAKQIESIPDLKVRLVNSNEKDWNGLGNRIIIIFFSSSCQICHYKVESIKENLIAFKKVNLLFISEESREKIADFSKKYKLDTKDNIWWLRMKPEDVYSTFGSIGVPHIWIYNKEGKLVKEFRGPTKVEAVLEWL